MFKFIVEYLINKRVFKKVLIEAASLTEAYILFMCKHPSEYAITEITETTGENLPADVELPKRPPVKYTIC